MCRYYNDIISTHPSVELSDNGDDEAVDEVAQGMIDAAQVSYIHYDRWSQLAGTVVSKNKRVIIMDCFITKKIIVFHSIS